MTLDGIGSGPLVEKNMHRGTKKSYRDELKLSTAQEMQD